MMSSSRIDPQASWQRSNLLWAALGALALGQLMALWLVCSEQVEAAQARQTTVTMQEVALVECLRTKPAADTGICNRRFAEAPPPPREPAAGFEVDVQGVVPVGYSAH
jgi:hypothetical protein